jgi:hypothetical protein
LPSKTSEKQGLAGQGGTDCGTPLDETCLQALAAELGKLTSEDRARLAALLIGEQAEGMEG